MAQIIDGILAFLSFPRGYEILQTIVGSDSARTRYVKEFVQPFEGASILDIGCGTGKILDYLPKSVEYVGVDLNQKYIAYASEKYKKRARFISADVSDLSEFIPRSEKFDIILATALLHHLDDEEIVALFNNLDSYLKDNGKIVTLDCVYVPDQTWIAKYIISRDRGQNVRTSEGYRKLIPDLFKKVEISILDDMLIIPYSHCILSISRD
jgi:cyclopropane fatty-acyl-phospholipid synthase-like methyltransferase